MYMLQTTFVNNLETNYLKLGSLISKVLADIYHKYNCLNIALNERNVSEDGKKNG